MGLLPAAGQTIEITNTGWKAVAISASTVQNFPQSLNPSAITLGGATDSFNVLLLNYAGYQTPLSVQQLTINSNSALTALSSSLNIQNGFSVGGAFNQGDYSVVSGSSLHLGDVGPGIYNLTNGTLLLSVTQAIGGNFSAKFNQFGGTNYPGNILLLSGGEYDFYDGFLATSNLIHRGGGVFQQLGGFVKAANTYITLGSYTLGAGTLSASSLGLPAVSSIYDNAFGAFFVQTGGTNASTIITIGTFRPPFGAAFGNYTLSNGVVTADTVAIGMFGNFTQWGGTNYAKGISMTGDYIYQGAPNAALYYMNSGTLNTKALSLNLARFTQNSGTNQVGGNLTLQSVVNYSSENSYTLNGGLLTTSNTAVNLAWDGGFIHNGGTHIVSNLLSVSQSQSGFQNFGYYTFNGGQLLTRDIRVDSGAIFHHKSGSLVHTGLLTLANGSWEAATNQQQFGTLLVGTSLSNTSRIVLPSGPAALRFTASSAITWSNSASLIIDQWKGTVSGSGAHQIVFGSNSSALSAQQLSQMFFRNPAGTAGLFPATILPTGEIVPSRYLAANVTNGTMTISWAGKMVLQTSTNISGPFHDLSSATTPYPVPFNQPHQFFRLRQ